MLTGWQQLLSAAQAPTSDFLTACANPAQAQASLLARIIKRNADTQFGRRHDFDRLHVPADFQSSVPVTTYEDYRALIDDIADGAQNVLTRDQVVAFEETGGTSSGGKLIPYTASGLSGFRSAVLPWLANLASISPGAVEGPCYVTISPATRQPRTTPAGIPVGLQSEAAYLGSDLTSSLLAVLAVSPEIGSVSDVDDWRRATLAALISQPDLSFISIWSPTFLTMLLRALRDDCDAILNRLAPEHRRRFEFALAGADPLASALWPDLAVISCWADGSSRSLAAQLAQMCPHTTVQPKGLLATEAAVTIPFAPGKGGLPALTSTFLEFVDAADDLYLVHELEAGSAYRVLVTTEAGLYRYDLGDQVRCIGHQGKVPRLVFEGRASIRSDLVGEKLDEAFVAQVLEPIPVAAMLVARNTPRAHYELWLDTDDLQIELTALASDMERALSCNPQYAHARKLGQLGDLVILPKPGFIAEMQSVKLSRGSRLGDQKHTSLVPVDVLQ
ncbi:MAG: GH3 auxin-responsive promoter family protein [Anderseniella sp.]